MTTLAVLGAGSWGTALANTAAENGHDVRLWTHRVEQATEITIDHSNARYLPDATLTPKLTATNDMAAAVADVDIVLIVVPTKAIRQVAQQLVTVLAEQSVIIAHATKGMEQGTFKRISEMLMDEIPARNRETVMAISGPSHAEDVINHDITAVAIAGDDTKATAKLQTTLSNDFFRAYTNRDLLGSELAAALKNIIALGSGALTGLGYGDNAKAALLTRGLVEMRRIGVALGAAPETFLGLAGVGDLIVTGMSRNSRNFRAGEMLASGQSLAQVEANMGMVIEGVNTTRAVAAYCRKNDIAAPITCTLDDVLSERLTLRDAIKDLMARPLIAE